VAFPHGPVRLKRPPARTSQAIQSKRGLRKIGLAPKAHRAPCSSFRGGRDQTMLSDRRTRWQVDPADRLL